MSLKDTTTLKDRIEEGKKVFITYFYITDKDDYKIKRPNSMVYPTSYPCVVESTKIGFFTSGNFIYDLTDFFYHNGRLYKAC